MIKAQTLYIKDKTDLRKVPTKFSGLIGQQHVGQTLIIVDGNENLVLTSKDVDKILNKIRLKDNVSYTFVTINLTVEAETLLKDKGMFQLQHRTFHWTGESYSQRKQRMHEFIDLRRQQLHDEKKAEDEREMGSSTQQNL